VLDALVDVHDEFSFRNSKRGIEDFMMRIEGFRDGVLVAVESTANLWIRLYDFLEEHRVRVFFRILLRLVARR